MIIRNSFTNDRNDNDANTYSFPKAVTSCWITQQMVMTSSNDKYYHYEIRVGFGEKKPSMKKVEHENVLISKYMIKL